MRRRCSYSIRRQARYAAIEAEHAQRDAHYRGKVLREARAFAVDSPDVRDPSDIAKAAAAALRGMA